MKAVEPATEASDAAMPAIPGEIAAQLPKADHARIRVLITESSDDADWRAGAYQQFLHDDPHEDAIYDSCP